ncbi:hypothetical protein ACFVAJ_17185 [Agromyces sp. NPDC057679]|uniref:hypothetical protein n=1 Tax=Agromyces sp. NPDC057679 TaxID=3346207 RepID=UPI00366FE0DD
MVTPEDRPNCICGSCGHSDHKLPGSGRCEHADGGCECEEAEYDVLRAGWSERESTKTDQAAAEALDEAADAVHERFAGSLLTDAESDFVADWLRLLAQKRRGIDPLDT